MARIKHLDTLMLMDAIAPGLAVAQAIGRFGNWFNQELFGRPTDLPWGLEIDPSTIVPPQYLGEDTFHPTFLYESLWCLLVAGTIVCVGAAVHAAAGQAFALYVSMYTFGRIFFEWLRVDPASELFGIRFNLLLSAVLCVAASRLPGSCWLVAASATAGAGVTVVDERPTSRRAHVSPVRRSASDGRSQEAT